MRGLSVCRQVSRLAASRVRCVSCSGQRRVEARHILVSTRDQVQELAVRLENGERFEDLAAKHSECASASNGGNIGWVIRGMAEATFEDAILSKPVGAITHVESSNGHHLVEVLNENMASETAAAMDEGVNVPGEQAKTAVRQASPLDLADVLRDPAQAERAQFIDVREPEEHDLASIGGFGLFPLSQMGSWMGTIGQQLNRERDTYVLCHHGVRSMHAANILVAQGFQNVYNVTGGIAGYSSQVDPSVQQY